MTHMKATLNAKTGEHSIVELSPLEQAERDAIEQDRAVNGARYDALAEIDRLEAEVTNRRLREAVLTQDGADWLSNQEALIAAERAKL